jgi:hypothetical protein
VLLCTINRRRHEEGGKGRGGLWGGEAGERAEGAGGPGGGREGVLGRAGSGVNVVGGVLESFVPSPLLLAQRAETTGAAAGGLEDVAVLVLARDCVIVHRCKGMPKKKRAGLLRGGAWERAESRAELTGGSRIKEKTPLSPCSLTVLSPPPPPSPRYHGHEEPGVTYRVYRARWHMLGIFSFLTFTNAFIWIVFAPIEQYEREGEGGGRGRREAEGGREKESVCVRMRQRERERTQCRPLRLCVRECGNHQTVCAVCVCGNKSPTRSPPSSPPSSPPTSSSSLLKVHCEVL